MPTSERVWFRSLYWRVAFGFVAFLAIVLVVQGAMLFWLLAQTREDVAGSTPQELATLVAGDVAAAMESSAFSDPAAYLRTHYGRLPRSVALVMADGSVVTSRESVPLAPPLVEMALRRMRAPRRAPGQGGPGGSPWPPGPMWPPDAPGWRQRDPGQGPMAAGRMPRGRMLGLAPVTRDGTVVAAVVVPPAEPLPILLRQFAPVATALAVGLLVVATTLAALFVFRPAQQRLRALEDAARKLGAGMPDARAPVAGGDEVTAVAKAFNAMADELDRRASALHQAADVRRQLLADVSHELMTPLTAIRGYLETLQMAELDLSPEARQRYLAIVGAETERLERVTGDLLDLARLEAGGGTLALEQVDVATLFQRVVERHGRAAAEKGVRIDARVDPAAASLVGDVSRLEQVLQNLAANALRHTAQGSVELRSEPREDGVAFLVRDTGEGIPPEHLARVFDRFYKADEARGADGRGSGLGLSIAKATVERHGGRISARSDPGRETVFEVVLPRRTT